MWDLFLAWVRVLGSQHLIGVINCSCSYFCHRGHGPGSLHSIQGLKCLCTATSSLDDSHVDTTERSRRPHDTVGHGDDRTIDLKVAKIWISRLL